MQIRRIISPYLSMARLVSSALRMFCLAIACPCLAAVLSIPADGSSAPALPVVADSVAVCVCEAVGAVRAVRADRGCAALSALDIIPAAVGRRQKCGTAQGQDKGRGQCDPFDFFHV